MLVTVGFSQTRDAPARVGGASVNQLSLRWQDASVFIWGTSWPPPLVREFERLPRGRGKHS